MDMPLTYVDDDDYGVMDNDSIDDIASEDGDND